ncbi:serine hydrolase [Actinosynnema sp. NPDC059335]|uniref:serine hydrolase n=1 Tax=Actinosynnema sp. NPDC059335 TaxID=3346804 RepID=UPI003672FFA4
MLLTRRDLLRTCGVAGAATLAPTATAAATAGPDDWFGWLRAHRRQVAAVLDDGRGGRVAHRPDERQPLASAVAVVHLGAYARAVEAGAARPEERVGVGEWERYHLDVGGGAHQASLRALGIRSTNGVVADDPHHAVTLDDLVAAAVRHGDHAAADFLRHRLGEQALRETAARWPTLPVPEVLGEVLRLVLGRRVDVRRYLDDPRLQLEVIGRLPDVPRSPEGRRPWAGGTWTGTAAGLNRAHRALTAVPLARAHLERADADLGHPLPPGVAGVGFAGGSLPGVVAVGFGVRWDDGSVGSAAVLVEEVDEPWAGRAGELAELVRRALLEPVVLREFRASLS